MTEKDIIRDAQRRLREELRAEIREQQYQPQQIRAMRRLMIGTVLFALLCFLMEFGQYLPFYPKDAYRLQSCTLVSFSYGTGRDLDRYSNYLGADGQTYRLTASMKDYIGRETQLYTLYSAALRTQYELPRSLVGRAVVCAVFLILISAETAWLISYLKYKNMNKGALP